MKSLAAVTLGLLLTAGAAPNAAWSQAPDAVALLAQQKAAMAPLAWMDGVWRGPAWSLGAKGKTEITQTERIGPFVGGTVKVLEGRGYEADGTVAFNAFGTVSFDPATKAYTLHSYAQGQSGDFPLTPTADGYVWTIPAGPARTIRYTAVLKDGLWREIGEMIVTGGPTVQIFEMDIKRVGDTTWPAAGAVPMK